MNCLGVIARACLLASCHILATTAAEPQIPRSIDSNSIESLYQVSKDVFSSGSPTGAMAFNRLHELGIKTVISVDGASPDLLSAKALGIRYIHIPTGYGRWSRTNQLQLVAAAEDARKAGPVLIHCHHGRHRGPTAVALICMGLDDWETDRTEHWLDLAGTGTNYTGLFKTVRTFKKPTSEELQSIDRQFPESIKPRGVIDYMTRMDATIDNIEQLLESTELDRQHLRSESMLLLESLRELKRLPEVIDQGVDFTKYLSESLDLTAKLYETRQGDASSLSTLSSQIRNSCAACHRQFRD